MPLSTHTYKVFPTGGDGGSPQEGCPPMIFKKSAPKSPCKIVLIKIPPHPTVAEPLPKYLLNNDHPHSTVHYTFTNVTHIHYHRYHTLNSILIYNSLWGGRVLPTEN